MYMKTTLASFDVTSSIHRDVAVMPIKTPSETLRKLYVDMF